MDWQKAEQVTIHTTLSYFLTTYHFSEWQKEKLTFMLHCFSLSKNELSKKSNISQKIPKMKSQRVQVILRDQWMQSTDFAFSFFLRIIRDSCLLLVGSKLFVHVEVFQGSKSTSKNNIFYSTLEYQNKRFVL